MYGLINNALKQFIMLKTSREDWERIRLAANIEHEHFETMHSFADEVTYELLKSYCAYSGREASVVLQEFGGYWVKEVAAKHYGYMLKMTGRTFPEFIQNLDLMHQRVSTEFDELVQPHFNIVQVAEGSFHVHYWSHRKGLAPFVLGLLHGLAEHFGENLQIEQIATGHGVMNSEVFLVQYV